jgi:hypothetical protein
MMKHRARSDPAAGRRAPFISMKQPAVLEENQVSAGLNPRGTALAH